MVLRHREDAKITRLRTIELFKHADKKALQHLASAADEITFAPGAELLRQGHRHTDGFVIMAGAVTVVLDGEVVAEIPEGEMVGELALFGHAAATATVVAKTEVDALSIPYNRFDQILDDNPTLTKAIAQQLAGRLAAMDKRHA